MADHCLVEFTSGYYIYHRTSKCFVKIDQPDGEIIKINGNLYDDPGLPGIITDLRENSVAQLAITDRKELYCTNKGTHESKIIEKFTKVKTEGTPNYLLGAQVFSTTTGIYYLYGQSKYEPDNGEPKWITLPLPNDFRLAIKVVGSVETQLAMIDRYGRVSTFNEAIGLTYLPDTYKDIHEIHGTILLQQENDLIILGDNFRLPTKGKILGVFRHWVLTDQQLHHVRGDEFSEMLPVTTLSTIYKWKECNDVLFLSALRIEDNRKFTWIINGRKVRRTTEYLL